jgi:hypothetical protein
MQVCSQIKLKLMKKIALLLFSVATGLCSFAQIPTSGLIVYYPMGIPYSNVSPLTSHLDASGNNRNLTVTSGFGHGQGRTGATGEAAEFNASTSDLRTFNYNGQQAAFQQTGNFTISAWVRLGAPYTNEYSSIVQVGNNDIFLRFRHDGAGNYFIQGGHRTGASAFAVNTVGINLNDYSETWRLITLRKSGNSIEILQGTTLLNTFTNSSTVFYSASDKVFRVGNSNAANTGFKGRIQDVLYYNRAITSTELGQLACSATPAVNATTEPYQNICPGTLVSFFVTGIPGVTASVAWYTTAVGGTPVSTATNFSPGAVSSPITYYLEAVEVSGCVSYARTLYVVTFDGSTPAPTNTTPAGNQTVCSGNTTTLTATGADLAWYADAIGGSAVGSGNSFTTPALTANATYYVEDGSGTCVSARTPIALTVTAAPDPFTITGTGLACVGAGLAYSVEPTGIPVTWDFPDGWVQTVTFPNNNGGQFTAGESGTISFTRDNGCFITTETLEVTVIESAPAPAVLASVTALCPNEATVISINMDETATGSQFLYPLGWTYQTDTDTSFTVTAFGNAQSATVTHQSTNICGTTEAQFTFSQLAGAANHTFIQYYDGLLHVQNPGAGVGHQWLLNGDPIAGANGTTHQPLVNGTYSVQSFYNDYDCATHIGNEIEVDNLIVGINESSASALNIYPNPATSVFTMDGLTAGSTITLMDAMGRNVISTSVSASRIEVSVAGLSTGIYMVQVMDGNNIRTGRLMVN